MKKNTVFSALLFFCFLAVVCTQDTEINLVFKGMIPPAGSCTGGCNGGGGVPPSNDNDGDCSWVNYDTLQSNLCSVVCAGACPCANGSAGENGGLNLNMWATVVNRAGRVCAVTYSGSTNTDQWPGSRAIAAAKANTANSFSLGSLAISTANLYGPTQPGGSLWGLQESNLLNTAAAYAGSSANYGNPCGTTTQDAMCGQKIGGVIPFGGGLALYDSTGALVGALGLDGDTSCADHNIAWKLRHAMEWDYVPSGLYPLGTPGTYYDNIIYPVNTTVISGFEHPICSEASAEVAAGFDNIRSVITKKAMKK